MLSESRKKILEKIAEYEREGLWDKDVEDDPETIPLAPDKIDYLGEKFTSRVMNKIANRAAVSYYEKLIKNGDFVIKEIRGMENYRAVESGAVITCNHFSVLDNYAIYRAIRGDFKKGQNLYKVIREGNYTNFKGLFGFFFRHCNTLPLSSNPKTMVKFLRSTKTLLARGEKILIYPEQAMWWNYKKPRPYRIGAYHYAAKNGVPVVPCFVTLTDSGKKSKLGFTEYYYTIHVMPPLYPDPALSVRVNAENMRTRNFELCKSKYEEVYGIPLSYEN